MTHQWGPYQSQQIPVQTGFQSGPWQSGFQNNPWQSGIQNNPWQSGFQGSQWQSSFPYQTMTGSIQSQGQTSPWGFHSGVVQPRVDLFETTSDVVVACEMPVSSPNDINCFVNDDSVTISANAFWATGQPSSFYRTIPLPTVVRSEQAEASYTNGLLEIRMPKSEQMRRRLRVNLTR